MPSGKPARHQEKQYLSTIVVQTYPGSFRKDFVSFFHLTSEDIKILPRRQHVLRRCFREAQHNIKQHNFRQLPVRTYPGVL
eukprot:2600059-Karenia_brevis.AAC.1